MAYRLIKSMLYTILGLVYFVPIGILIEIVSTDEIDVFTCMMILLLILIWSVMYLFVAIRSGKVINELVYNILDYKSK